MPSIDTLMKKILLMAVIFFGLEKGSALPIGNPSEASLFFHESHCCGDPYVLSLDIIRLGIGYYGDYVFNRYLETETDGSDTGRRIDYSQIYTNAGYLVLNFWDQFDFFTTFGTTKFKFNTSLGPFNGTNTSPRFDFESSTAFSWSVGARGTLWEYQCLSLGIEGQYFSSRPNPKVLFIRANVDDYPGKHNKRKYSEWQIGTGVSYRYSYYFVPYVAVKYARALWKFENQTFLVTDTLATIPNLKSHKNWGYAIGATLAPWICKKIAVTVEGRFADEAAVYVNGQVRF